MAKPLRSKTGVVDFLGANGSENMTRQSTSVPITLTLVSEHNWERGCNLGLGAFKTLIEELGHDDAVYGRAK